MVKDYIALARSPDQARFARHHERTSRHTWAPYKHMLPSGIALLIGLFLFLSGAVVAFFILKRQSSWDGQSQRAFVVISGDAQSSTRHLTIVMVRGKEKSATVFPLPDSLLVETLYGYGPYKAESLPGLGKLEKLPYTFITQSLAFGMGIDVRDVIVVSGDPSLTTPTGLQKLFMQTLLLKAESSLSYYDRYTLWALFGSVRRDQMTSVDVLSTNVLKRNAIPGGELTYSADIIKMDALIPQLFSDVEYQKERKVIAVINTTTESKLATRVARALTLMGADVVNIQQVSQTLERTRLEYEDEKIKSSRSVSLIRSLFGLASSAEAVSPQHSVEFRADIVLFLGNDAAQLFTQRLH